MPSSTIRTDGAARFRRLGVAGREVVSAREQIASILRNRIGRAAASLFAVAQTDGDDGQGVIWRADSGGHLSPVASLSHEREQALRERHRELAAEIVTLASRLDAEGESGRMVGYLLRLALVTPDGHESLYAADDQPVLVDWGHAVDGQPIPEPDGPLALSVATASSAGKLPIAVKAPAAGVDHRVDGGSGNEPDMLKESRARVWWIAWLAPLSLLGVVVALVWNLTGPAPPIAVSTAPPVPPPSDTESAARSRLVALEAVLANARAMRAELVALCQPDSESSSERRVPMPPPAVALGDPSMDPAPAQTHEPPPAIVESEPKRESVPLVMLRSPVELPPEVPRALEAPSPVAQLSPLENPSPTLCKPGWTPTERPEVMVVVDGSGSMQDPFPGARSRLDAAKDAISRVVRGLHQEITTGLVSFTDCGETSTPQKYAYRERPDLLVRVRGLSAARRTSLANSIRRAGNAAKSVGPVTVVVVSDGEDTCGGDPCRVARALKDQKPLLQINVLDLSGGGSAALQCVAEVTGGRVFVPGTVAQMSEELQEATGQPDAGQCNP